MSKLVHIPESSLAQLLREAGRTESVEEYLRSGEVQETLTAGNRLIRRARAAYWSRFWLFFSALVSWVLFFAGPDFEGFLSCVLLTGMTVVEFKVHAFFLAADPRGATYGWWNQCLFAVLFLIYGGYHGTFVTVAPSISAMADPDVLPISMITALYTFFYYTVALVGAIGQFSLACYYRAAAR
jgi:hypothetical protein